MKKTPRDVITLHKSTKNCDHMVYCSWDMTHGRCNCYFSFWAIFCLSTLPNSTKNQISKKWKKWDRQKKRYIEVGAPPKKHKSNFHYLAIFMMTSQILRSMHFKKTQKSRYLENETFLFLQIKKFINYT